MERLTKKDKRGKYYTVSQELGISDKQINPITSWIEDCEERNFGNPINKLGRLEDLEEEIGCPLDVVFKALNNGVYYEDVANRMKHKSLLDLHINSDFEYTLIDYKYEYELLVKNYKITWWLREDKSE